MNVEATAERYRDLLSYDPDTGELTWKPRDSVQWDARYAGQPAFPNEHNGYRRGKVDGVNVRAHRVIWMMVYEEEPEEIDHINGDRSDNRLANLRNVSTQENARNRAHIPNASGVTGVLWDKCASKWKARIKVSGKEKTIGVFPVLQDAIDARKRAERKYGFHENHGRIA